MAGVTTYQYILYLTDKMSATMKRAGYLGGKEYDKLQAKQEKLNRTAESFKGIAMKMGLAFGAFEIGKKIITAGADIERTRVSFATFLGDVEKGNAMIKQLQDYADVTPFTSETLQQSAKTLLGFGINAQKIMPTLKMLGDVSGGDSEKMRLLTLAYAQMSSAGKLMGQDLLQMINAGFNPLQVISQKAGKSMSYMRKEMEQGRISSQMVEDAFKTATSEGGLFYGMMDKMGKTVAGRWSTLMDGVNKIFRRWGENSNSSVGKIIDSLSRVVDFINNHLEAITKWGKRLFIVIGIWKGTALVTTIAAAVTAWYTRTVRKANASLFVLNRRIGGTGAAMGVYSGLTGVASLATKLFANSFKALGKAIYSVPIFGWIIAGITAVVTGFTILWNKSEKFRGIIFGIWEVTKTVFSGLFRFFKTVVLGIGKVFSWLKERVFTPIITWFRGMFGWLINLFEKIIEGVGVIFKPIIYLWNKLTKSKFVLDLKSDFSKGYEKGVENFRSSKKKKGAGDLISGLSDSGLGGGMTGGLGETPSGIDDTSKGIAEGGSRPTNINITLGNLVESLNITPATMKEGATEIQRIVQEALLRVLNSANGVAYGN